MRDALQQQSRQYFIQQGSSRNGLNKGFSKFTSHSFPSQNFENNFGNNAMNWNGHLNGRENFNNGGNFILQSQIPTIKKRRS